MRKVARIGVSFLLLTASFLGFNPEPALAATVTATGTNPTICNQTVSDSTNVVAYRLSGGDCVVEFRNVGSTTWTAPQLLSAAQILVIGGGGGGAARHSGGGGGGGVLYVTNYKALPNTNYSITVGDGGAGAPGLSSSGGGRAGANSSFGGTSGTGSIVANGGGGGWGGNDAANVLNFDGTNNASPSRGSGGGSNYDTNAGGASVPGTASDVVRAAGSSSMTVNGVSATVAAYGKPGGVGKGGGYCYGTSTSYTGWCGGGGGGAGETGTAPSQPGSVNPWKAGNGGAGISISITGTATTYAGGGGGGSGSDVNPVASLAVCTANSPLAGNGGSGGGGAGSQCLNTAGSGTANTGGGGGGAGLAYISGTSDTQGVGGKGGSGIVIIRYTPDSIAPTVTGSTSFSVVENIANTSNAATITSSESSTVSINAGSDGSIFSVIYSDSVTSFLRFLSSPNYESPSDVGTNNVYDLSIRVTDTAGNYTDQSISITVTNVNEAPLIGAASSAATYSMSIAENSTSLYNLNATDQDSGATLSYSLTGTDANDFSISSAGLLSFSPAPDFENPSDSDLNNIYIVIAWVSDGSLSDSQTVTITVTNANEAAIIGIPSISGTAYKGLTISLSITVNTPGKTRFFFDNKRIANCLAVSTSGTNPNYTATCNWKPITTGLHQVSATFNPTDGTFTGGSSQKSYIFIQKRITIR